jgi:hypothetical protein
MGVGDVATEVDALEVGKAEEASDF